jgi:hypothetical protein
MEEQLSTRIKQPTINNQQQTTTTSNQQTIMSKSRPNNDGQKGKNWTFGKEWHPFKTDDKKTGPSGHGIFSNICFSDFFPILGYFLKPNLIHAGTSES